MLRGLFVTGTDTGVGKTAVAAALVVRLRSLGRVVYWKPIQTGIELDDDTATVRKLASCSNSELFLHGIRLPHPVSPHLAAERAGIRLSASEIAAMASIYQSVSVDLNHLQVDPSPTGRGWPEGPGEGIGHEPSVRWIVEGAGGALVPLNETETMADLMTRLALPVLIVARSTLGTINHTLLTLEALRQRQLTVAGVVLVGEKNLDNRRAIERFGRTPVIAEMPLMNPLTPETLQAWAVAQLDLENTVGPEMNASNESGKPMVDPPEMTQ